MFNVQSILSFIMAINGAIYSCAGGFGAPMPIIHFFYPQRLTTWVAVHIYILLLKVGIRTVRDNISIRTKYLFRVLLFGLFCNCVRRR
jgi:hypothetical protein